MTCFIDIKNWMSKNLLQLNDSKSEVLIFTTCVPSSASINNLSSSLGVLSNNVQKEARNLGVVFDSELSFDVQVTKVVQSSFAQLRQLTKIKSFLSLADLEKVIHAFITFMHLADASIQSDLHCIQVTVLHLISSCFPWESNL